MSDSARQTIAAELRQLRKLPGPLDVSKMTHAPTMTRGFGGADPSVALTRLLDLAQEHSERDIDAAIGTMGVGLASESVLDRLSEYGEPRFVDARTVRRWSDAGIRKLALLIVGKEPWLQPLIRQILTVEDEAVKIGIDLRIPPNLRMSVPRMWVNRQETEVDMPRIVHSSNEQRIASGLVTLARLSDLPLTIRLEWMGEKYPKYESVIHGTAGVLFTSCLVFVSMRTTIRAWVPPAGSLQNGQ